MPLEENRSVKVGANESGKWIQIEGENESGPRQRATRGNQIPGLDGRMCVQALDR